jgi:DNA/RNA-binding domain of Phe-tRNA-synthetase-like protein
LSLKIDSELKIHFPELTALTLDIDGVNIRKKAPELENFKLEVMRHIRNEYTLDSVKDLPTFRAYRTFFWSIGIDPTKTRPAAEALTRRILAGKTLPCINTLVDTYNLASIKTRKLLMRFAKEGEQILGIGMEKPLILKGREIIISDQENLTAVYPHRDADNTKVTEKTENVSIVVCGVPGITEEVLESASDLTLEYITRFCSGEKRG